MSDLNRPIGHGRHLPYYQLSEGAWPCWAIAEAVQGRYGTDAGSARSFGGTAGHAAVLLIIRPMPINRSSTVAILALPQV
jgi:hypothetical protein